MTTVVAEDKRLTMLRDRSEQDERFVREEFGRLVQNRGLVPRAVEAVIRETGTASLEALYQVLEDLRIEVVDGINLLAAKLETLPDPKRRQAPKDRISWERHVLRTLWDESDNKALDPMRAEWCKRLGVQRSRRTFFQRLREIRSPKSEGRTGRRRDARRSVGPDRDTPG